VRGRGREEQREDAQQETLPQHRCGPTHLAAYDIVAPA
jgi:hypothetical protein